MRAKEGPGQMNWSEELIAFRKRNQLKQEAVADMLGVSQAQISRLENGAAALASDMEARLRTLLQAPDLRPPVNHCMAVVDNSPYPAVLLGYKEGQVMVVAASQSVREHCPALDLGHKEIAINEALGEEAGARVRELAASGAFQGAFACMEALWRETGRKSAPRFWRTVLTPARKEGDYWFLHGSLVPLDAAAFEAKLAEWGGPVRWRRYEEESDFSSNNGILRTG